MNQYIDKLIEDNKLRIATDRSKQFGFKINNKFLGKDKILIAGPCSIESKEMIIDWACEISKIEIDALRAGAYKPCTFPVRDEINGWKEGMKEAGLDFLKEASEKSGLETVSEIMDHNMLTASYLDKIDIIQVGTRNFQNYTLLDELGKIDKPIILKRGTWGTLDEILGACERILNGGNEKIAICLRGVVGGPSYRHIFPSTRWMPDLMMIPALKKFTNIPIIYDPSHATGLREFVVPVSKAALAIGADGLIVEVHPEPSKSISDPDQAIGISELIEIKSFYS